MSGLGSWGHPCIDREKHRLEQNFLTKAQVDLWPNINTMAKMFEHTSCPLRWGCPRRGSETHTAEALPRTNSVNLGTLPWASVIQFPHLQSRKNCVPHGPMRIKDPVPDCAGTTRLQLCCATQNNPSFQSSLIVGLDSLLTCADRCNFSEFGATFRSPQEEFELGELMHLQGLRGSCVPETFASEGSCGTSHGGTLTVHAFHEAPHQDHHPSCLFCFLPTRHQSPGTISQVWASPGHGAQAVPALATSPSLLGSSLPPKALPREAPPPRPMPALTPDLAPAFPHFHQAPASSHSF